MAQNALDSARKDLETGATDQARRKLAALLKDNPQNAEGWFLAGRTALAARDRREAIAHLERAFKLQPKDPRIAYHHALLQFQAGRVGDVIKVLQTTAFDGGLVAPAHTLLGVALSREKRWDDAIAAFDSALATAPDDTEAVSNRGATLFAMGRTKEGVEYLLEQHHRLPRSFSIIRTLGHALFKLGRAKEAAQFLEGVAARSPNPRRFYGELSTHFYNQDELEIGLYCARKAVEVEPEDAAAHGNLGVMYRRLGRYKDAFGHFKKSVDLDPSHANGWNNLGNIYSDIGNGPAAAQAYKKAIDIDPDFTLALSNVCRVLLEIGDADGGAEAARKVLSQRHVEPNLIPFPFSVIQNVADFETRRTVAPRIWQLMDQVPADRLEGALLGLMPAVKAPADYDELYKQQCRWGDFVKSLARRQPLPALDRSGTVGRKKRGGDRIRIGFLSSDLRSHNVTKFLMPVFRHYDRDRMELHCYSAWPGAVDPVQKWISETVDGFVPLKDMSHRDVAKKIREDQIDIVIEFNGITRYSQARAIPYRCAPVQLYWLGYPFTLGLEDIDYHLLDPYVQPASEDHMRDKPLVMKKSWICFQPADDLGVGFPDLPVATTVPALRNGHVTFGTLNKPYKYNETAIGVWAQVLDAVPGSKMMIARPEAKGTTFKNNMEKAFAAHGIGSDRLIFVHNAPGDHMRHYNEIDISLDTFPLVGGTTTTESLWMGVPVISLIGREMFERMGKSINTHAGIGDLCPENHADYIACATALAADTDRLVALRGGLRATLRASPLCDGPGFMQDWLDTLETTLSEPGSEPGE